MSAHFKHCYVYEGAHCSCGGNTGGQPGPDVTAPAPLPQQRLTEIRESVEAATAGGTRHEFGVGPYGSGQIVARYADGQSQPVDIPISWERFARLAAAAPTDMRDLLDEVDRLRSWNGLMSVLDEHYPARIFKGTAESADEGVRTLALIREIDRLRSVLRDIETVVLAVPAAEVVDRVAAILARRIEAEAGGQSDGD